MNIWISRIASIACLGLSVSASAQTPDARPVGPVLAFTTESLGLITAVRALPGGLALVNDVTRRRLLLVDSKLAVVRVVADSAVGGATAYGARPAGLIPYRGDSTLFVDPAGLTMFVIDPAGVVARVMSVPRSQDVGALVGLMGAQPGFDAAGRLVYRAPARGIASTMLAGTMSGGGQAAGGRGGPPVASPSGVAAYDSAALQRVDVATRRVDSVAWLALPRSGMSVNQTATGISMVSRINPLPMTDEWAVMEDGTIAVVRGRTYHVDWIDADGTVTSSPRIPFEWQRLSDDDKLAVIDSARAAMDSARARGVATGMGENPMVGGGPVVSFGGGGAAMGFGGRGSGGGGTVIIRDGSGGDVLGAGTMPQTEPIAASDLPDYRPAFGPGAARADRDGNLWVRINPVSPVDGGAVYDVIDRNGKLIDRVRLPAGRTIVGFAPDGVIYMFARTDLGARLERAVVPR